MKTLKVLLLSTALHHDSLPCMFAMPHYGPLPGQNGESGGMLACKLQSSTSAAGTDPGLTFPSPLGRPWFFSS